MSNLFNEIEISRKRYDSSEEELLKIFNNLSSHWYFDGLELNIVHSQEGNKHLIKTNALSSNPAILGKHCIGYMELNIVFRREKKPVDVRLVCSWAPVLSFWQELDKVLGEICKPIPMDIFQPNERGQIVLQTKEAGRKPEPAYDIAYKRITEYGMTNLDAYNLFLKESKNQKNNDKYMRDSFKSAMRRRRNRSK